MPEQGMGHCSDILTLVLHEISNYKMEISFKISVI